MRALIGAENLAELEKGAYASFRCPECGLLGTTIEPTSVVARRFRKTVVVDLAHAECTRSLVDYIDADPPPGLDLDGSRADMRVMTLVLEYRGKPRVRPLLLLERRIEAARFTAGGEKINVTLAALLRRGLEPVRSADQLPWPAPRAPPAGPSGPHRCAGRRPDRLLAWRRPGCWLRSSSRGAGRPDPARLGQAPLTDGQPPTPSQLSPGCPMACSVSAAS